jgi:hypothetical protein
MKQRDTDSFSTDVGRGGQEPGPNVTSLVKVVNVVCPIDLSPMSRQALDYATTLARWYDARTTVLYVAGGIEGWGGVSLLT